MRSNKTILVVDDDLHIRRTTELKMKAAGYRVVTACNGREGIELIRGEQPDAVITDITMPDIDGREMCTMTDDLKTDRPFLTVVLTARIAPGEHEWIDSLRDTMLMEKPFSLTHLLGIVDQYLGVGDDG